MIIQTIWYDFSDIVTTDEVQLWIEKIKKEFEGKLISATELADMESEESVEEGSIPILFSDKISSCMTAKELGIPYLLYLHDGNRDANFSDIPYAVTGFEGVDAGFLEDVYRRFYNVPWEILETERLLVREMTERDLDALYEIYDSPQVTKYTESLYEDREEELAYIKDYIDKVYRFYGYGIWVVIHKESGKLIGRAGLACREGYDSPELGYVIGVPFQGQGYATEVCQAILQYADENLGFHEIRVVFQPDNEASRRLCSKLGFREEKELQIDGKVMMQCIYRGNNNDEQGQEKQ